MQSYPIIKFIYSNFYEDSKKPTMETTHEVITRLKFIGLLKKGEKINVKNLSVQQTNMINSLIRMFYKESRETTLDFLTSTINRAFEIIQLDLSSPKKGEKILSKNLSEDLEKSLVGLSNLQHTYTEDRLFWCHIQTLIEAVVVKLRDLRANNADIFFKEVAENMV